MQIKKLNCIIHRASNRFLSEKEAEKVKPKTGGTKEKRRPAPKRPAPKLVNTTNPPNPLPLAQRRSKRNQA